MAAPTSMTSRDLSGKFILNKELSKRNKDILDEHNVAEHMRNALANYVPHLTIRHRFGAEEIVDISRPGPDGQLINEHRLVDAAAPPLPAVVYGREVMLATRRVVVGDLEFPNLGAAGWLDESFVDGKILYTTAVGTKDGAEWRMAQTWGFENIKGEKRHTRRVHVVTPQGQVIEGRLVYDYEGSLPTFANDKTAIFVGADGTHSRVRPLVSSARAAYIEVIKPDFRSRGRM
ncbi:uncharacterized protein BXZ73DRAFT_73574 [Epithele typhae]|uniref:uncharacterized protein n=1 Tax=Epithele typhae TaxID=378194 RepID=UPI0020074D8A|nr:uncharacterized protein BXZ73DRAFT_73574 [Epithele typhae]KAH9945427.1 hypothetical protein BXZ73DRAFT_73574 [Epithele typhae]